MEPTSLSGDALEAARERLAELVEMARKKVEQDCQNSLGGWHQAFGWGGFNAMEWAKEMFGTPPALSGLGVAIGPVEYMAPHAYPDPQNVLQDAYNRLLRQTIPSRVHEQDTNVRWSEMQDPTTWSEPRPLLPPDPEAYGSLHWLQHASGHVRLGWWDTQRRIWHWADGRSCFEADGWAYHSQLMAPDPLPPPADPETDRLWAAVQELGKR